MSLDLYFNKQIPSIEELNKYSIKVELHEDNLWMIDEYDNHALIRHSYQKKDGLDSYILELTFYGLNNYTKILDILVEKFNMKFFSDQEEEDMFRNQDSNLNYFDVAMKRFGYKVNDVITLQDRDEIN